MRNWSENQQIFSFHHSVILPEYLLLYGLVLQLRMVAGCLLQLVLDVADGNMPRKLCVYQIFLWFLLEIFIYSHHSIFIVAEKKMAQLFQVLKGILSNTKSSPVDRVRLVMLYCSQLRLYRLLLMELKKLIQAKIRRNLSRIGQQVKDKKRCTERQDLDDDYWLQSAQFFSNFFLPLFLFRCQRLLLDLFEHHQIKVILEVLLESKEAFLSNMRGLLAIHDRPLKSRLAVIGLDFIELLLPNIAVLKQRGDSQDFKGFQGYHLIIICGKIRELKQE